MSNCKVEVDIDFLVELRDLQEYWFNRTGTNRMSEAEYKTWHALGFGSDSYRKLCSIIREKLNNA